MKKIILIVIAVIVLLVLGFFGWRVFYFYRLIKSGNAPPLQSSGAAAIPLEKLTSPFSPRLGTPDAKIKIVEFADFSCEFSAEAFPSIRELAAKYPDKISLVFRFFPGHSATEVSQIIVLAAFCAHEQGKFWPYHDKLFQNRGKFSLEDLGNYAAQTGLDTAVFDACVAAKKFEKQLEKDTSDGAALGVQGTPTFFVNGEKVEGAIPLQVWEKALGLKN